MQPAKGSSRASHPYNMFLLLREACGSRRASTTCLPASPVFRAIRGAHAVKPTLNSRAPGLPEGIWPKTLCKCMMLAYVFPCCTLCRPPTKTFSQPMPIVTNGKHSENHLEHELAGGEGGNKFLANGDSNVIAGAEGPARTRRPGLKPRAVPKPAQNGFENGQSQGTPGFQV